MVELDKVDPEYQEITFNEVSETFSQEELEGKDVILIRDPADVNIFFVLITFLHIYPLFKDYKISIWKIWHMQMHWIHKSIEGLFIKYFVL